MNSITTVSPPRNTSITGPYLDTDGRYRIRIYDGVNEIKKSYKTEKEALTAKARLSVSAHEAQSASVSRVYREGLGDHVRWRVHVFDGRATTKHSFKTEGEAEKARTKFLAELSSLRERTVEDLIVEHLHYLRRVRGIREESLRVKEVSFRRFFEGTIGLFARSITVSKAEELYRALSERPLPKTGKPAADATHQGDLRKVRSLYRWALSRGLVAANPFAAVELIGRAKRGKRQHTVDQAKQYVRAALQRFEDENDRLALASVIVLTTGGRASEVMLRTVGEVDRGGTTIHVRERDGSVEGEQPATAKNERAKRELRIAVPLVPYILALVAGRPPHALLFRDAGTKPRTATTVLRKKVHQICRAEGLPIVTTHSFRGLRATLEYKHSRDSGATAELLGHSDFKMTEGAYLDPRIASHTKQEAYADTLGLSDPVQEAKRLLASASPATLRALVNLLPAYVPGLLIGSTTLGEESFPDRSREADRHMLSDGN